MAKTREPVSAQDKTILLLESTKRVGIKDLIQYLKDSDFFYAPASTRYHGAYDGGLADHGLNVLDAFLTIYEGMSTTWSGIPHLPEDSIILVTLLHDLCKVNTYEVEQKWRKDDRGQWESYDAYVRKPLLSMGHAAKSIFIIQQFIKLTPEEAQAIFWHMGAYDTSTYNTWNELSDSWNSNLLAFVLHQADMMATYILENEVNEYGKGDLIPPEETEG